MMRTGEVAEILGVDGHTTVRWIKERGRSRLPSGRYRIPESEVNRIIGIGIGSGWQAKGHQCP